MSEVDALMLLSRFRGGEEIPSLLAVASHMPKIHTVQGLIVSSQNQQSSSWSPVATEFDHHRNGSPVSLGAPATSSLPIFEPRIDVFTPTDPFRLR